MHGTVAAEISGCRAPAFVPVKTAVHLICCNGVCIRIPNLDEFPLTGPLKVSQSCQASAVSGPTVSVVDAGYPPCKTADVRASREVFTVVCKFPTPKIPRGSLFGPLTRVR